MAARKNRMLCGYFDVEYFIMDAEKFNRDTYIYIDSQLGKNRKREMESNKIFDLGFENIIPATGMESFDLLEWIKKPQGKEFPY
jgi:hypothetical protein